MTDDRKNADSTPEQGHLGYDPKDMMGMRVLPADLARMYSVTRQTVSRWIRQGTITIGPDGRIDPTRAAKQLMKHADLNRMRTRIFRDAMQEVTALRNQKTAAEMKVAALTDERDYYRDEFAISLCWCERFLDLMSKAATTLHGLDEAAFTQAVEDLFYQAGDECRAGATLPDEWRYSPGNPGAAAPPQPGGRDASE